MLVAYEIQLENRLFEHKSEKIGQWIQEKLTEEKTRILKEYDEELQLLHVKAKLNHESILERRKNLRFKRIHTEEILKSKKISWGAKFQTLQSRSMEETKLKKELEDEENEEMVLERNIIKMESKIYAELISANKN